MVALRRSKGIASPISRHVFLLGGCWNMEQFLPAHHSCRGPRRKCKIVSEFRSVGDFSGFGTVADYTR